MVLTITYMSLFHINVNNTLKKEKRKIDRERNWMEMRSRLGIGAGISHLRNLR